VHSTACGECMFQAEDELCGFEGVKQLYTLKEHSRLRFPPHCTSTPLHTQPRPHLLLAAGHGRADGLLLRDVPAPADAGGCGLTIMVHDMLHTNHTWKGWWIANVLDQAAGRRPCLQAQSQLQALNQGSGQGSGPG